MSKILGTITALILAFAGMLVAAPTHATEHPTPVTFTKVHDGIPRSIDLYVTRYDGTTFRQQLGNVSQTPMRVCPKPTVDKRHYLTWSYKASGVREVYRLKPGQCTSPGPGPVYVEVWRTKR